MKNSLGFRSWFYFRMGWSTYFAFVMGAVNTLTVTYYLAIERVPALLDIFPTFIHYTIILVSIGIPILIVRTKTNQIKVFHNICSHRGLKLVS